VKRALAALAGAFAYFTILPIGRFMQLGAPDAGALSALPLVGAVIGVAAGGFGLLFANHGIWSAIAAWCALIVLTGAIHLDGFLDSCDALFASVSPERRLEILRDPRHGTFAIAGMAILTAVSIAALAGIAPVRLPIVLAFSAAASRLAVVPNAWMYQYARAGAVTRAFTSKPNVWVFLGMLVVTAVLGWFAAPLAVAFIPALIAVDVLVAFWMSRRLGGGLTGDTYGALISVNEALLWISFCSFVTSVHQ
jgi:adenosylcobinamide-GDP ribazoletransferase